MRSFLKYGLSILLISLSTLFVLDYCFTEVYVNKNSRNKISLAHHGKVTNYDVLFFGSSRANNHFIPQLFIDKGYKSFNFGMSGSRLEESALILKLLLHKGTKIKNIVLEVDLNINSNGSSEGTRALFFPYINNSKVISDYYRKIPNFEELTKIPFYRYMKYEAKIGFREMYFTAVEKETSALQFNGFYPLKTTGKNMSYDLSRYHPQKNNGYEAIKKLCSENGIKLIVVTTPMCENIKNKEYFDDVIKLYPEIHNLENVVKDDNYFSSCGHMNEKGAEIFTKYILDNFFK